MIKTCVQSRNPILVRDLAVKQIGESVAMPGIFYYRPDTQSTIQVQLRAGTVEQTYLKVWDQTQVIPCPKGSQIILESEV